VVVQQSITESEIKHRLGYHRATFPKDYDFASGSPLSEHYGEPDENGRTATAPAHAVLREAYIHLANLVVKVAPGGREQSLALTALQESLMWANAGVAMRAPLIEE